METHRPGWREEVLWLSKEIPRRRPVRRVSPWRKGRAWAGVKYCRTGNILSVETRHEVGREVGAPADRLKVRTRGPRVIINSRHCARQTVYPCDPDGAPLFFLSPSREPTECQAQSSPLLVSHRLADNLRVRFTEPSMALFLIAQTVDLDYTRGEECRLKVDALARPSCRMQGCRRSTMALRTANFV